MFFPTLVYEVHLFLFFYASLLILFQLDYPRTDRIRIGYVIEKIVMTVGCMACLHLVSQHYVYPALLRSPDEDPIQVIAELVKIT